MAFAGVCWCLMVSVSVVLSGDVKRVSEEFFKAYLSAVYGCVYGFVASEGVSECYGLVWCSKCPYLKISERQNSTHLTLLKHQNTKTSLYKLSKNHWVIALFKKIGSVRKRLQSTVSLDHLYL